MDKDSVLEDYSIISLGRILKEIKPKAFISEQCVRIINTLDFKQNSSYIRMNVTLFPFGNAHSKEYNQYTAPVLLIEVNQTLRFIYCEANQATPIFVKKHIMAFRLLTNKYRICVEYLLFKLSLIFPQQLQSKFNQYDIPNIERLTWFLQVIPIKYPSLSIQYQLVKGKIEMQNTNIISIPSGETLNKGKYIIHSTLGSGGFGITYLATDNNPESSFYGKKVAIKELFIQEYCYRNPLNKEIVVTTTSKGIEILQYARNKFIGEIAKIRMCNNPNIIQILDTFEENNTYYYVMEYLSGGSLEDRIQQHGPLSEEESIKYIKDVANALKDMHQMHLLHLDIKPTNILLRETGEAVLIDFGSCKHYDSLGYESTRNPLVYSYNFASPEQIANKHLAQFLPQVDIYALGQTLYYLLSNELPSTSRLKNKRFSSTINKTIRMSTILQLKNRLSNIDDFLKVLDGENIPDFPPSYTTQKKRTINKSCFFFESKQKEQ